MVDGRVLLSPDLRGHGAAAGASGSWTIADLAADVHAVLAGSGPADVVGLSLGGMVAQQLALDHPGDVRSLVLLHTTGGFGPAAADAIRARGRRALDGGMEAVVDETLERWFEPGARVADPVRAQLLAMDSHAWAATWDAMAGFDARARLREIELPVLVVSGDADRSTPPQVAVELVEALPRASLRVVRGAGHLGPLEQPARYGELIRSFLERSAQPLSAA
jgi:3-oxoadipate enol-lactonase